MLYLLELYHPYQSTNDRARRHFWQYPDKTFFSFLDDNPDAAETKYDALIEELRIEYKKRLAAFIHKEKIKRVFEDANGSESGEEKKATITTAEEICEHEEVNYTQLNPTRTEREEASFSSKTEIDWREEYWVEKIKAEHENSGNELLIAGKIHLNAQLQLENECQLKYPLVEKLRNAGIRDTSIVTEREFWAGYEQYTDLLDLKEKQKNIQPS